MDEGYVRLIEDLKAAIEHGMLVGFLAYHLSKELGMDEEFASSMRTAGLCHDIGKLRLSEYLYGRNKNVLGVEEIKYVRMHSAFSREILKKHGFSDTILEAVYHHHENYDGSGYPDNLKEDEIPVGAMILRTCDVFAALVSDRPYRAAFDLDTALSLMIDEVKNFNMKIFLAFSRVVSMHTADIVRLINYDLPEDFTNILGIE